MIVDIIGYNIMSVKIKKVDLGLLKLSTGATDGNRTHITALARPCTNHCTTAARISKYYYIRKHF